MDWRDGAVVYGPYCLAFVFKAGLFISPLLHHNAGATFFGRDYITRNYSQFLNDHLIFQITIIRSNIFNSSLAVEALAVSFAAQTITNIHTSQNLFQAPNKRKGHHSHHQEHTTNTSCIAHNASPGKIFQSHIGR